MLTARSSLPLEPGRTARVMVRPERLHVRALGAADASPPKLRGVVSERAFLGDATKYFVRVGDLTLIAKTLTIDEGRQLSVGAEVALDVAPDAIVVLVP